MKRILSLFVACVMLAGMCLVFAGCGGSQDKYASLEKIDTPYKGTKLYVYNWGEYISDGQDDSYDLVKVFETIYGIDVSYTTYSSNEEMYAKLSSGAANYDIVIPSDYMIARLIEEGLIQKINYANIPNYANINSAYKTGQYYDMNGEGGATEYSVPYSVGMIGVVYNTKYVSEADAAEQSWGLLWNGNYRGKILNFNNSRDAFGVAMFYKGLDVNSTDEAVWNQAYEALMEQKPLLKGLVMDEIFEEMEGGNAYVGTYYAGDCITMMENNEDLAFYYPKEGTNLFVDACCITKNAQNVGAAELFINFLLDERWATENALYICYASPNDKVINSEEYKEALGDDYYSILYDVPEQYKNSDGSYNTSIACYYYNLDADTKAILSSLWDRVK
ncbi:MAG: spermidine/putrescine ABC transporter substrate-binding protein [Clostridia bacterium]|nr:spermidine/putrescine ABC transporter substrate-binding protein [Clostridia bacterium]